MFGIVVVDKPLGITSHGVISALRRRFNVRRIGHAGTLDPLASGVLVAAVGPATRFLQYLDLEPKIYQSTFKFGVVTTTYDQEGEVVEQHPVPSDLKSAIQAKLADFRGSIEQTPPIYSAIKRQGKPLYAYARKGESVEIPTRTVFIERFDLLGLDDDSAKFEIVCSGGTYIRSLAHDLGAAVECGAHVLELRRTAVGSFTISDAVPLDDVTVEHILPLHTSLGHLPRRELSQAEVSLIRNGRSISSMLQSSNHPIGLFDPNGNVVGIARVLSGDGTPVLQPECVIPAEFDSTV